MTIYRSKKRSPNIIQFHILDIVKYCAIVILSLRQSYNCNYNCFDDIPLQKCCDVEIGVRGHSRLLKVAQFDKLSMVAYQCSLATLSLKHAVFEIFDFKNAVTLKTGLRVLQGQGQSFHFSHRKVTSSLSQASQQHSDVIRNTAVHGSQCTHVLGRPNII